MTRTPTKLTVWLCATACWCARGITDGAQPAAGSASGYGTFLVRPIDGPPTKGALLAISQGWQVVLQAGQKRTWSGSNLLWLRRPSAAPRLGPAGAQVVLANGDRIRARVRESTEESLVVNSELLGTLSIPLERVRAVLFRPPAYAEARERLVSKLLRTGQKDDRVAFLNGDELSGTLLEISEKAVRLDTGSGPVSIPRQSVRSLALNPELIDFPPVRGVHAELLLADGSVLTVEQAELARNNLRGRAAFGPEILVPVEQLVGFDFRNDRVRFLSDVEPEQYREVPFLSMRFGFQRDRNVVGGMLRLRGRPYRKGLGVHSGSELSYGLDGSYERFEATVGIDDCADGGGNVVFRVLLDGEAVWESQALSGRDPPQPVRVDLGQAHRLTLAVDYAGGANVLDRADWAAARLVRPPPGQ